MRVIGDKNQISEDVFDFKISYLLFPQKSIRSELAYFFFYQYTSALERDGLVITHETNSDVPVGVIPILA